MEAMETMAEPKEGRKAPDFSVKDQDGKPVRLKELRGKKVALYFYPKDATPGCTKQACSLRDSHSALKRAGIIVLGISPDSESSHQKFITKQDLPFTLLADTEKKVAQKYGVWGEKSMYGRKYMGIFRTTFLIDETGTLIKVITKPKVAEHAEEVLQGFKNG